MSVCDTKHIISENLNCKGKRVLIQIRIVRCKDMKNIVGGTYIGVRRIQGTKILRKISIWWNENCIKRESNHDGDTKKCHLCNWKKTSFGLILENCFSYFLFHTLDSISSKYVENTMTLMHFFCFCTRLMFYRHILYEFLL